ncbi:LamG-like jellyroll fold domain-containing protein [Actinomadura sp. WMMB 499]|uniref:LamG-like jellyroll fold domain-containing protein n=1 Tax=Actinomadura sp. WMMB 499 TaxID=1219491 RepID=UPI001248E403|nr:LamG-like jellyroll fold domain-containing protein [Actinomadura sp. WMMB 499]QFG21250.1 hypothetical protein F7P10_08985 [Actinomadura sp. WMMB 499]
MAVAEDLVKVYSDRTYVHTAMVRHQGTVVAFAMDDARRIVYSVLDLAEQDEDRGELDAAYWHENPRPVRLPAEIAEVGYGVAGTTAMPVVTGGGSEASGDRRLTSEEIDPFLSTTARLSAAAPFQVLSDGTHIVLLRQSIGTGHPGAVFKLNSGDSSGDPDRTDYVLHEGTRVPLVRDTLLADRFLLVGGDLTPVRQVRYRRSRHASLPDSAKDTLGTEDMEGRPFYEPTQELSFVRNLTGGRFAAVLVPTAVHGVQRWQIFAGNEATGRIDSFNIEQARDGLLDTQGSRYYTSPDPQYQDAVYERAPGTCPFTGQELIPTVSTEGYAEAGLGFDGTDAYVHLGNSERLRPGGPYTVEAWISPKSYPGHIISTWNGGVGGAFRVYLTPEGRLGCEHNVAPWSAQTDIAVPTDRYTHVASVYDGTTLRLYVDGRQHGAQELGFIPDADTPMLIGAMHASGQAAGFFHGAIDEVRIWERVRTGTELRRDMHHRLVGNEPGLLAYYRFDEGSGTTVHDQTDHGLHGEVRGTPAWITSDAPVGDHPGVRRDSFALTGRTVVSGLAASLYYQQEDAAAGYDEEPKPAKRQARVLLAAMTGGPEPVSGQATDQAYAAVLDFGVGRDGRLAQVPDELSLPTLVRPAEDADLERVSVLEQRIGTLATEADRLKREIDLLTHAPEDVDVLERRRDELAAQVTDLQQRYDARQGVFTEWYYLLRFKLPQQGVPGYVAVRDDSLEPDAEVVRSPEREARSARWVFEDVGQKTGTGYPYYRVRNVNSGLYMGIPGPSKTDGAVFVQWSPPPQNWDSQFSAIRSGDYRHITNRYSESPVSSLEQFGDKVVQWDLGDALAGGEGLIALERAGMVSGLDAELAQANRDLSEVRARLDQVGADTRRADELRLLLPAREADLSLALEELANLTGASAGADDVTVAMPPLGLDRTGLSHAGGLLEFARGGDTPHLAESATGAMVLYFRGANGQFFAAYYDTAVARGVKRLPADTGAVLLRGRNVGPDMSDVLITVSPFEDVAALCDLTIHEGEETETWSALPRQAADLAAVLNGDPGQPTLVGTVAAVDGTTIELSEPSSVPLPDPSFVLVGGHGYLVRGEHPAGTETLHLSHPSGEASPAPGDTVTLVRYDPHRCSAATPGVSLAEGSRLVTVESDATGQVQDGEAAALLAGRGSRWRGDMPGRTYIFRQGQHLSLPADRLEHLALAGDLTLESWVNAGPVNRRARLIQLNTGDSPLTLALADASQEPREEDVPRDHAMFFDGVDDDIDVGDIDLADRDFTVEFWMKRVRTGKSDYPVSQGVRENMLYVGFRYNDTFVIGHSGDDLATAEVYTDLDWHHWAAVFHRDTRQQVVYRDGVEVARRTAGSVYSGQGAVTLGWLAANDTRMSGALDEVRIWGTARTAEEVQAQMRARQSGIEPGLLGYWRFREGQCLDATGRDRHGVLHGSPTAEPSPLAEDLPEQPAAHRVVTGVGNRFVSSRDAFPCGEWSHLAVAFRQSWAVRLDGAAHLEAGTEDALNCLDDLTVEVAAQIDRLGTRQGLVSKGRLADGTGGSLPYQLLVLADGRLEFAFEEPGGAIVRFASTQAVTADGFHRIAVVRKAGRATREVTGTQEITTTGPDGRPTTQSLEVVESVQVTEWDDIRFHIDGNDAGGARYEGVGPKGNAGPLELGRARDGDQVHALTGVLAEVRLWSLARDPAQLGAPVTARDRGLVAQWRFTENDGNTTADTTGSHPARLRGAAWTRDPDPAGSDITVYRNGTPIACDPIAPDSPDAPADYGDTQLTLGAMLASGVPTEGFAGTLEEVRLWRVARSEEQILDNLFARLKGDTEDLVGYWPFDRDSTVDGTTLVRDHGLRGNHLRIPADEAARPRSALSTAPISGDAAQVRSALAAIRTPFHETISGTPAVAEYADLQHGPRGEAAGVLKRCYGYLRDGRWHLVTGYKVGDLATEWVGQVQFDPQLVGYVEGAPPAPSENLVTGVLDPGLGGYTGVTAVEVTEAEEVIYALSSAKDRSVDAAFSASLSNEVDVDVLAITAPLGFGTAQPVVQTGAAYTASASLEYSNGWGSETSVTEGANTSRSTTVTLTGRWEDPARVRNPHTGRRFLPANTGFAIVQSLTADVFALRLSHNGALVAYRIRPNTDIPKDWNVLPFPVNPRYVKQGTLDGTIGFDEQGKVLDSDYPDARDQGEYSYFKPREAYAIKRRIRQDEQRRRSYYETVSTQTHTPDPTAERAGRLLSGHLGDGTAPERRTGTADTATGAAFSRRDLVNTYVWTAQGGFFAETTEVTDAVTETTSGSYSLTGSVGASAQIGFQLGGIGVGAAFDASIGGGMSTTRARGKEATRSFGLTVDCDTPGDMQRYGDDLNPMFDADGEPVLVPGRVDAYRWNTYYLSEDTANFEDFYHKVVDPAWLEAGSDPNAAALRQARQTVRKPPCWRVLHRVTFVSRLLPQIPPPSAPPLEQAMRAEHIDSNYELIKRLEPYVRAATSSRPDLSEATRTALRTHLPELIPHADDVIDYLALYYGLDT